MVPAAVAPALDGACIAAFGLLGPDLARRSRPAVATWFMTVAGCLAAAASVILLALVALPTVGRDDLIADRFHWSAAVLAKGSVAGRGAAGAAALGLVAVLAHAVLVGRRQRRAFAAARKVAAAVGHGAGGVVVVRDAGVDAYALGGARLVVVTEGLVKLLPPDERAAVIAHERAHVIHRHHLHVCVATIAAAVNPLLWRLPASATYLVERWADEQAARATSRTVTAAALSRVAASASGVRPTGALAAAQSSVERRIAALQSPPRMLPIWWLLLPVLLLLVSGAATFAATDHAYDVIRLALSSGHHVLLRSR